MRLAHGARRSTKRRCETQPFVRLGDYTSSEKYTPRSVCIAHQKALQNTATRDSRLNRITSKFSTQVSRCAAGTSERIGLRPNIHSARRELARATMLVSTRLLTAGQTPQGPPTRRDLVAVRYTAMIACEAMPHSVRKRVPLCNAASQSHQKATHTLAHHISLQQSERPRGCKRTLKPTLNFNRHQMRIGAFFCLLVVAWSSAFRKLVVQHIASSTSNPANVRF